jgi:hypothetical protein
VGGEEGLIGAVVVAARFTHVAISPPPPPAFPSASSYIFSHTMFTPKPPSTAPPPWPASAGSYIFSQTIFSMRAGVASYLHGIIIFVVEAAIFLLPISGAQQLPPSCRPALCICLARRRPAGAGTLLPV